MTSPPDERAERAGDWLDGCLGYRVESDAGLIGRVAEIQRDADSGRPDALVVRAGMGGWQRFVIPVADVAAVLPGSRRIVLNAGPSTLVDEQPAPAPAR